ncbi:MAG: M48 family metalloprotease [Gammaproteobacteria bacterium]|nr:M48 family metalloprotease [Gammaproteobacteria bacterium]
MSIRTTLGVMAVTLAGILSLSGCAVNPVSGEQEFVLMSEGQELALGRRMHPQILEQYDTYDDPELQAYVQRVGEKLAAKSHRQDLIYRFTVLDSDEVNAFALPGGYIYITRGLMSYFQSEEELAAVLGHEIGHVTARHSVRQYSTQQATGLGIALGSILVPELRDRNIQNLLGSLGTALVRGYGREHELEADRLGAEYLARTGRDPEAMIDVIRVLKAQEEFEKERAQQEDREPKTYHGVFATHPDNDTRLQEVVAAAGRHHEGTYREPDRAAYLRRLEGVPFGPPAKEGVVRGNGFYHRDLGFALRFPEGWRIENKSDRVLAIAPGNDAVLQLTAQELNKRLGPRQFMAERMNLKTLEDDRTMDINGLPAHTGLAPIQSPWGRRLARHTVILFRDRAYVLTSAAKDPDKPRAYNTAILNTAFSFHPLTPKERELATPLRLAVIRAGSNTRFANLAAKSRISSYAEARLRLLNGYYPDGEPRPGEFIKVVR